MADGRKNNTGKIGNNGGRPPKSDEIALIARLSPMDDLALKLLNDKLEEGDMAALKMFMEYRWSKPKARGFCGWRLVAKHPCSSHIQYCSAISQ